MNVQDLRAILARGLGESPDIPENLLAQLAQKISELRSVSAVDYLQQEERLFSELEDLLSGRDKRIWRYYRETLKVARKRGGAFFR